MFHHIKGKVKPNKTKYLIIIKENQIYNISNNSTKDIYISLYHSPSNPLKLTTHLQVGQTH